MSTKEEQYNDLLDLVDEHGFQTFGLMANESWINDPKRTLFTLSRYKFVAKILAGYNHVLEIGCADAFGTRIVQQHVGSVLASDFDMIFLDDVKRRTGKKWNLETLCHDFVADGEVTGQKFDAAYCLDVLEHILPVDEEAFLLNIRNSLTDKGVFISGMPSLESQEYASPQSKVGHVNCKTGSAFKAIMEKYYNAVFMFSMNDEVLHTGFFPMSHYLFAVCSHPKS